MKKIISILTCLFLVVTSSWAAAVHYTPDNLPKVHLTDRTRYVCDPAGILSTSARDTIDRILYNLEQGTGIESVVAVVPSIGEAECFDFCHQLLNSWGVGKKGKDNGIVILLVTDQRCIQFYTGYGLEGILPDAICKRIQVRDMVPYLKNGNWNEGMVAGIKSVSAILDGSMTPDEEDSGDDGLLPVFFILITLLGVAVFFYGFYQASKCPNCGAHKLQRAGSRVVSRRGGVKAEDVTYICSNCGHRVVRRENSYDENYRGGGGGTVIFGGGGFSGGSFSGGGFSGGSFGGGLGGGGGAGTRF